MRCKNCNATLAPNAHFCVVCGAPVSENGPASQPAMPPETQTDDSDEIAPTVFIGDINDPAPKTPNFIPPRSQSGTDRPDSGVPYSQPVANTVANGPSAAPASDFRQASQPQNQAAHSPLPGIHAGINTTPPGNRPNTNTSGNYKAPKSFDPRMLIPVAVLVLVAIVAVILFVNRRKTIDLTKYVTIQYSGYNGYGTASMNLDQDKLLDDVSKSIRYSKGDTQKASSLIVSLVGYDADLDKASDLKNGDSVTMTFSYDNESLKKYHLRFKGEGTKRKVKGLKEVRKVNPFDYLNVTFDGVSPNASMDYEKKEDSEDFMNYINFEASQTENLSLGDTVTITATCAYLHQKDFVQEYGCELSAMTQDYAVEGVGDSRFSHSDLEKSDILNSMKKKAKMVFESELAQQKEYLAHKGLKYEGYYLLIRKEDSPAEDANRVFVIYSTKLKTKGNKKSKYRKAYLSIRFRELVKEADGTFTVNLDDYDRIGDDEISSMGIQGFKNISNMKFSLITVVDADYDSTKLIR
ncbi:MAG: hypothetical protein MR965_10850 [Lachnospiraceae bacterium]|nr:hypothetical protein [Lachnospiraceae bacterium]